MLYDPQQLPATCIGSERDKAQQGCIARQCAPQNIIIRRKLMHWPSWTAAATQQTLLNALHPEYFW